jgi:hypothetical protein
MSRLGLQRDLDAIDLAPAAIQTAASATCGSTSQPTKTSMAQYQTGSDELAVQIPKLKKPIDTDIRNLEKQLDAVGAPPTSGAAMLQFCFAALDPRQRQSPKVAR